MTRNNFFAIGLSVFLLAAGLLTFDHLRSNKKQPSYVNSTRVNSPVFSSGNLTPSSDTQSVPGFGISKPTEHAPKEINKKIRNLKLDTDRTIEVHGQIGMNAIQAAIIIAKLNAQSTTKPIYLLLDSPGGGVLAGSRLVSSIQTSKAPVYTVCLNMCASMAFMIHQYGVKRFALDRAILMSHPASVGYEGDVDRIASFIGTIQRYTNKLEAEVAKRMGLTFDAYKQKIQNEFWVDAEDALKENVVDELVNIELANEESSLVNIDVEQKKIVKAPVVDFIWMYRGTAKTK